MGSFTLLRGVAAAAAAVGMWATRTRRPSAPPQAGASCPRRFRPGRPSFRPATPPSASCRPAPGGAGFRCTTVRQNTHKTGRAGIGGYEAVVAYRWHAWFGRTVHVHELIDRNAGVVARCRLDDRASGAIQEVPLWMLDAASCATMHDVATPQASVSALAALSTLLSEVMARSPLAGEASDRRRIGFHDHPQGDRHAASVTPSIDAPARAVPGERAASTAGSAKLGGAPGPDPAHADEPGDADADRPRRCRAARADGRRR